MAGGAKSARALFAALASVLWLLLSGTAAADAAKGAARADAAAQAQGTAPPGAATAGARPSGFPGPRGRAEDDAAASNRKAMRASKEAGNREPEMQPEGVGLVFPQLHTGADETASAIRIVLGLTLLAVLPSMVVCLTSFMRIIIVLSMLRHAVGMPETPPNTVLVGLALFLSVFTMNPVLQRINVEALEPFMSGQLGIQPSVQKAAGPLREFMLRQTREHDIGLMVELSKSEPAASIDDVGTLQLVPAFMLSELRSAFQIAFVVFLPFLLIDLIVSSVLMSLGMMMMPPMTVALPLKVLMFVLVDGWSLLVKALVGSFR